MTTLLNHPMLSIPAMMTGLLFARYAIAQVTLAVIQRTETPEPAATKTGATS